MTYSEKLKSPKWQKRRLEKLESTDWSCEICGDADEELNVHHPEYIKGREPWEYPLGNLQSLCRTCHELSHVDERKLAKFTQHTGLAKREAQQPRGIRSTDTLVFLKLLLTDAKTREFAAANASAIADLPDGPETDLIKCVCGDPEKLELAENAVITLPAGIDDVRKMLNANSPGDSWLDASRSLKRLEIRAVESSMEKLKGDMRAPAVSAEVLSISVNKVMEAKQQLVAMQKQLQNIG